MYFGTLQFSQKGERSAGSERRALRQARTRVNASANAQYPCPFARSASPRASDQLTRKRGVTVLLVKGRSYAQPDPRAFADAILRRE
jgi:hypothetical protein